MSNLCEIDVSFLTISLYNMTHFESLSMMVQLLCQNLIRILRYLFYKVSPYNTSY
jgi:hypothetical protein